MQSPFNAADLMLVLLSDYPPLHKTEIHPREMTQHGISEKLGVSRPHVAKELKRLREHGQVDFTVVRVATEKKKRKAYSLTQTGKEVAVRLAEAVRNFGVPSGKGDGGNGGTLNRVGENLGVHGAGNST